MRERTFLANTRCLLTSINEPREGSNPGPSGYFFLFFSEKLVLSGIEPGVCSLRVGAFRSSEKDVF